MSDNSHEDDDGDPMRDAAGPGELDPVLVAVLSQLWRAHRERPDGTWSLARLSRQAAVPMSGLRRLLTALVGAGLVETAFNEEGGGSARLCEPGQALCAELFSAAGANEKDTGDPDAPAALH